MRTDPNRLGGEWSRAILLVGLLLNEVPTTKMVERPVVSGEDSEQRILGALMEDEDLRACHRLGGGERLSEGFFVGLVGVPLSVVVEVAGIPVHEDDDALFDGCSLFLRGGTGLRDGNHTATPSKEEKEHRQNESRSERRRVWETHARRTLHDQNNNQKDQQRRRKTNGDDAVGLFEVLLDVVREGVELPIGDGFVAILSV